MLNAYPLRNLECYEQVCIVAFKKAQMEVKAHAWDRSLGGRDLDAVLVAHFGDEFKSKTGFNISENAKAGFRMKTQVEKSRQILTTGPQAPISVECLMEDTDFRYLIYHVTKFSCHVCWNRHYGSLFSCEE